jgi:hypothetical protein
MPDKSEAYLRGRRDGVKDNEGRYPKEGVNKTICTGGMSDGGGSGELSKAAKSINTGNRKGGLAGL